MAFPTGPFTRASLGADAAGGFAATVSALPQIVSLGVLAFAALGPAQAGAGVAAALLATIVGNIAALPARSVTCQILGARSSTTALLAGLVAALVVHPAMQRAGGLDVPGILALVFLAVALSGLIQLVLGLAGVGRAIKYVPYPVVAGFMNGVAVIILLAQLRPALGLVGQAPLATTLAELGSARWGSFATALAALGATAIAPRVLPRVPRLMAGLVTGFAVHYAIAAAVPAAVGPVVGPLPSLLPDLDEMRAMAAAVGRVDSALLWELVVPNAVLLAVVGAVDGLLAAVVCDGVTRGRHDGNRVLVGQGWANLAGGLLGALPSTLNTHTPIINYQSGGRTPMSAVLHVLFTVALVAALAPVAAAIPAAALAGLMLFIAYSLVDRWSSDLIRRVRTATHERAEVALNIAIVALVAVAQVSLNVVAALAIGIAASVALLVVKLSGTPVRRRLDGAMRASHKVRSPEAREALRTLSPQIRILELQGEIFFGTADSLQSEVEDAAGKARFVILDFRRVHQIDASGARVLEVIGHRAGKLGLRVALAHVGVEERLGRYLEALGIRAAIPVEQWFMDLDRALEWAEDELLEQSRFAEAAEEWPLERMSLLQGLGAEEIARVGRSLERIELTDGDAVFHEGDEGDRLYLIAQGAVSIKVRLQGESRARRLATFTPGVMFGEMALIERKRRSADAFAKGGRVVLYALSAASFETLLHEAPAIGAHIHRNLGRELAARLRSTSEALRALE